MTQQLGFLTRRRLLAACLSALLFTGSAARVAEAQASFGDTVRFLEQATFGPNGDSIDYVQQVGFRAFLDEQFAAEMWDYPDLQIWPQGRPGVCTGECQRDNYTMFPLQSQFFQNALYGGDQLRQRVAFALGQILVVSPSAFPGPLKPSWVRGYQQLLYDNAFGNYRQLLYDLTINPSMGRYLDMVNNVRFNPVTGIKPNENYAREILQLFSIGLFELNQDGTIQLDPEGNPILSYSQDTIEEFSRVFTGWILEVQLPGPPEIGGTVPNYRDPMRVRQPEASFHDTEEKELLNGVILPADQSAWQDLDDAINNIMAHQSVAPLISKQLIQKLVTSNPSPDYVGRVAAVFAANVESPTQLQAVVEAILLDPEARGDVRAEDTYGHLKEPVLAITNLLRAFGATNFDGSGPSDGVLASVSIGGSAIGAADMGQNVLVAPTVFNFYEPFFEVPGEDGVLGPEFQIYSSLTAIRRVNFVHRLVMTNGIAPAPPNRPEGTAIDLTPYLDFASDPAALVDAFNGLLLHGTMSPAMADLITTAVSTVPETQPLQRVRTAVYLVATSSQYQVER